MQFFPEIHAVRIYSLRFSITLRQKSKGPVFHKHDWRNINFHELPEGSFRVVTGEESDAFQEWMIGLLKNPRLSERDVHLIVEFSSPSELNSSIGRVTQSFRWIDAAGGMVFNPEGKVLMIFRKGFWDLPKGKLDSGEQLEACALREVEEETGIHSHRTTRRLSDTYHVYFEKGNWILKRSAWWIMQCSSAEKLKPQTEEQIAQAVWMEKKDVMDLDMYPLIRDVVMEGWLELNR